MTIINDRRRARKAARAEAAAAAPDLALWEVLTQDFREHRFGQPKPEVKVHACNLSHADAIACKERLREAHADGLLVHVRRMLPAADVA